MFFLKNSFGVWEKALPSFKLSEPVPAEAFVILSASWGSLKVVTEKKTFLVLKQNFWPIWNSEKNPGGGDRETKSLWTFVQKDNPPSKVNEGDSVKACCSFFPSEQTIQSLALTSQTSILTQDSINPCLLKLWCAHPIIVKGIWWVEHTSTKMLCLFSSGCSSFNKKPS